MSQVRSVRTGEQIDEVKLLEAHRLARIVFEPEVSESEHGVTPTQHRNMDLELWREKLKGDHADILYIMGSGTESMSIGTTTTTSQSEPQPDMMLGMFLNYPRSRDGLQSYHIFISAVHPSARGRGLFSILLGATEEYARAAGYAVLTVSTIPELFPRMFSILSREGSGWEVLKWEGEVGKGERKVVMKMVLR